MSTVEEIIDPRAELIAIMYDELANSSLPTETGARVVYMAMMRRAWRLGLTNAVTALTEAGMAVVPVEPTEAMLDAAEAVWHECLDWSLEPGEGLDGVDFEPAWEAMIAAAKERSHAE